MKHCCAFVLDVQIIILIIVYGQHICTTYKGFSERIGSVQLDPCGCIQYIRLKSGNMATSGHKPLSFIMDNFGF